jgi:threonyl-tRNA synthetase
MALKPMSCPCHVQVFNNILRSWRELLICYAELGACQRNEPSGSLHGLVRTRFEQGDTHVFCRDGDALGDSIEVLSRVYSDLGFPDYAVSLSVRPTSRAGSDEL